MCIYVSETNKEINKNMIHQCQIEKRRFLPHCYSDKGAKQIVNQK